MSSDLLNALIDGLRVLPSVGPRSARRMALHLLQSNRKGGLNLAEVLSQSMTQIKNCQSCRNFTEQALCSICNDSSRDETQLCVVENPADVDSLELTSGYTGRYFVLMGRLSPLDGLGPYELGMDKLFELIRSQSVKELIIATGTSVEGDATAQYISDQLVNDDIAITRLASGIPSGGDLEALSGNTLKTAFANRQPF
ncbi:recombination mediator RecR [Litoribacillus peritrichatus]|uniref:Recombination protein RecR n=1 Tax=Litoribacillus peritrichatus TaxID=718191 RepID=A0ABP7N7Z4_9GAMM